MDRIKSQQGLRSSCTVGLLQPNGAENSLFQRDAARESRAGVSGAGGFTQGLETTLPCGSPDGQAATRTPPVMVKRVTTSVFAAPRLAPTYIDIPVPVYVPRYVEVPVPVAKLDGQLTQQLQQQNKMLRQNQDEHQHDCLQQLQSGHFIRGMPPIQKQLTHTSISNNKRFIC